MDIFNLKTLDYNLQLLESLTADAVSNAYAFRQGIHTEAHSLLESLTPDAANPPPRAHTLVYTHTRTHAHARTRARTHAHARTRAGTRTRARCRSSTGRLPTP